jgi:hypothetical protein
MFDFKPNIIGQEAPTPLTIQYYCTNYAEKVLPLYLLKSPQRSPDIKRDRIRKAQQAFRYCTRMGRGNLQALLILGVAVTTSSSFVTMPTSHVPIIHHSQAVTTASRSRTSSQLFLFENILDALTGRSDNNSNNSKRRSRPNYKDDDRREQPIKRFRGEPGLSGTSSPYYGPMPYGYANGNSDISPVTTTRTGSNNFVPGGQNKYYPRQERLKEEFAAYRRTDGTTILPQQLTSSTLTGTNSISSSSSTLGVPATARGIVNFPNNNNNSSNSTPRASPTATTTQANKAEEESNKFIPGGEAYYPKATDEGKKKTRTTATSSRTGRVNGDFDDYYTGIRTDPSVIMAGTTKDQMAIQLKQALDQVQSLAEDNKMLVRELRVARGVEEDLVAAQERLELEVARLQKQMIQLQNRYKTTDYERQDLTQKINLYVQERDATRISYEDNLDLNNRLAQAERRLRLTGIYINEDK